MLLALTYACVVFDQVEFWSTICDEEIMLLDEEREAAESNTQPEHK